MRFKDCEAWVGASAASAGLLHSFKKSVVKVDVVLMHLLHWGSISVLNVGQADALKS